MALQGGNIADLVALSLNSFEKFKWTDISYDLQEHSILPQILKKEKVQFDSGTNIEWKVQIDHNHGARHLGLYATDVVTRRDTMTTATIPWRHCTNAYSIDEREIAMNSGASKIVDLVKTQRHAAWVSLAGVIEDAGWTKPADSTDDTEPFGIPYWIVKNATAGFTGTNPTGFTAGAGGLSSTTYPNWANYSAQYTTLNKSDAVKKMRKAAVLTGFMSPVDYPELRRGANRYVIYTSIDGVQGLEDIAEQQNDSLGKDVASMDGRITFRRNPVQYVPKLDADTSIPFYGINWAVFYPVFLKGFYLKEKGPQQAPLNHNVQEVHIDLTWNLKCCDRRRLWIVYGTG